MAAIESGIDDQEARSIIAGEEVGCDKLSASSKRNLFGTDFDPKSVRLCNGWEMLPAFEVEEIGNANWPKKKPKGVSCEETVESIAHSIPRTLPEEMVEKIMSLMPYPYILDARKLSKEWKRKLSSTSPENAGFREMVQSVSYKWPSYFPLIFTHSTGLLTGFDSINRVWIKVFQGASDLEGRSREMTTKSWELAGNVSGAGSLVCGMTDDMRIIVSNVFTGAWKCLPDRPNMERSCFSWMHLLLDGPNNYRVLSMTRLSQRRHVCEVCTQVYDSKSNSWSMKLSAVNSSPFHGGIGVHLNGVVYFTQYDIGTGMLEVWAYNVEEGSWHPISHPLGLMLHTFRTFKLMVCQNQLTLVVCLKRASAYNDGVGRPRIRRNSLILYLLDPHTEKFSEVYRGPQKPIPGASASLYVSEGDSIYFGRLRKKSKYLMEFNVRTRTWSSFPSSWCANPLATSVYSSFALQPGKNPFIDV